MVVRFQSLIDFLDQALEGALTCAIAMFAYCWLPESPTKTTGIFFRKPWFTPREEKIMVNRVLRDDPAKGLTALHNKISFADIKDALSDRHLWPLIFLGLIAYIPQVRLLALAPSMR